MMRAVLTSAHGGREVLEFRGDFPDPVPQEGEVVVRVAATGVNYHDIFTRRGMQGVSIQFPIIVGSDIAGVVDELGPGADARLLGRRVLIDPILRGGKKIGMLGETVHGGRAERVAVRATMLIEVPDSVGLEHAAALPLAYGTAYRMMITRGAVSAGERVLVLGASGGVGMACVQLAKMVGATVIACASSDTKLQRLRAAGADEVVNYAERPFEEAVREICGKPRVSGGGGVQVAVNFTGGDTMLPTQKCVTLGGRILTCGATAGFELKVDARYWWTFEHSLVGSNGWSTEDLRTLLGHIADGELLPAIDKLLPLDQAAEAERLLEDREVCGKVIIKP
jgi:alcohol dehydrogenase